MVRAAQAKWKWKQDQSQTAAPKSCQHQDLPDTADLFMGDIIQKCWVVDGYWDMKDVRRATTRFKEQAQFHQALGAIKVRNTLASKFFILYADC